MYRAVRGVAGNAKKLRISHEQQVSNTRISHETFAFTFLYSKVLLCYRELEMEPQPYQPVLRSRSRKEPHLLVGAGARAGAVTRCGSGNGIYHS
jgi:hypothetical protein